MSYTRDDLSLSLILCPVQNIYMLFRALFAKGTLATMRPPTPAFALLAIMFLHWTKYHVSRGAFSAHIAIFHRNIFLLQISRVALIRWISHQIHHSLMEPCRCRQRTHENSKFSLRTFSALITLGDCATKTQDTPRQGYIYLGADIDVFTTSAELHCHKRYFLFRYQQDALRSGSGFGDQLRALAF